MKLKEHFGVRKTMLVEDKGSDLGHFLGILGYIIITGLLIWFSI